MQQSFKLDTDDFFGTGMMVVVLKHTGTTAWLREMLEVSMDICKLISTFPEHPARYVVSPCCMEGCLVIRPEAGVSSFQQQSHFSSHPCVADGLVFADVASH